MFSFAMHTTFRKLSISASFKKHKYNPISGGFTLHGNGMCTDPEEGENQNLGTDWKGPDEKEGSSRYPWVD